MKKQRLMKTPQRVLSSYHGLACWAAGDVVRVWRWMGLGDGRRRGMKRGNMGVAKASQACVWLIRCERTIVCRRVDDI